MAPFFSSDCAKLSVPILVGVVAWFANESRKQAWEEYTRKEIYYKELLLALPGFRVGNDADRSRRTAFLDQVRLCWLYCPDEVIKKAYGFLTTVQTDVIRSDADREHAVGEFVVAIRKDMLSRQVTRRTLLEARDYRDLAAT